MDPSNYDQRIGLDATDEEGRGVDPLETLIANDAYCLALLSSGIILLVEWLQVASKHSVACSIHDGSNSNALAELIRFKSPNKTSAKPTQSALLLTDTGAAHDETKEGNMGMDTVGRLNRILHFFFD